MLSIEGKGFILSYYYIMKIFSVSIVLDCKARGHRFNSQDWNNTQGLKITKKVLFSPFSSNDQKRRCKHQFLDLPPQKFSLDLDYSFC